jgi:pimeloyl-ACP methyl ester carboxylesterase
VSFAETDGGSLYYETHGEGEPVLIHPGFGSTVELFFAITPALAQRYRVIAFDPRGSGRSTTEAPSGGSSMAAFADDAARVLDAAGADSAFVLGTSFGGMVVQHLALQYPERVRKLVLACTTPGGAHHVLPPPASMATFMAASAIEDPAAAARSTFPLHYSEAYAREHGAEIEARSLANAHLRSTAEGRSVQLTAVQAHDTYDRLPEIRMPVMVAHGGEDGIVPFANAKVLAERIPNARLCVYEGAKHIFFVERADELNRDMIAFFEES